MSTTSDPASIITCPKEYQTSEWGQQISNSDVWEGPMADLIAKQNDIRSSYTTTQLSATKGGHGRLVATLTINSDGYTPSVSQIEGATIEVEWMELRKPTEAHPRYNSLTGEIKTKIRSGAISGVGYDKIGITVSGENAQKAVELYGLLAGGTTEYSTGVPVVRRTTKNAFDLTVGWAWYKDNPPINVPMGGSGGSWDWMKTTDRRVRVGIDVQRIEEWTGAVEWSSALYT